MLTYVRTGETVSPLAISRLWTPTRCGLHTLPESDPCKASLARHPLQEVYHFGCFVRGQKTQSDPIMTPNNPKVNYFEYRFVLDDSKLRAMGKYW